MAKTSKTIKDFSGGLTTGIDPSNLKDNQLVKCTGLVASGSGKLGLVCNELDVSTSSIDSTLPRDAGKNIHGWSSDMEFSVAGQPNNVAVPAVTETLKQMISRLQFYCSPIYSETINGIESYPSLDFSIRVNGAPIVYIEGGVEDIKDYYEAGATNRRVITNPSYAQEQNSNVYDANPPLKDYMAICFLERIVERMLQERDSSDAPLYPIIPQIVTDYEGDSQGCATQMMFGSSTIGTDFYVTRHSQLNSGQWGNLTKYTIKMFWEQRRRMDIDLRGNLLSYLKCMKDTTTLSSEGSDGNMDNYTPEEAMPFHYFSSSEKVDSFTDGSTTSFMYFYPENIHTDYWGQANEWKYTFANFNSFGETALYGITVKYYTNYLRSSFVNKNYTYQSQLGDTHVQVINGIFGQLPDESADVIDHQLYLQADTDTGEVNLTQANKLVTKHAYGFDVSVTKTNVVSHNLLGPGRKYEHLVAVGGANSKAHVYSMQNDNWLTYPIDLRQTANNTTANTVKLSFLDAEGYLRVSDSTFMSDNKPKWFGYFNANKTYENTTLVTNAGFFEADMAPTPYGYDDNNNIVGVNALNGQATHIADRAHSMYAYTTDEQKISIAIPKHGSTNTQKSYMPHPQGLKLWYCFIDGASGDQSSTDILPGTFMKNTNVELYWTYVYEGGYVSQPTKFRQWHTNSNLQNKHMSINPLVDECSLGLGLGVGKQLMDGDGSSQVNVRLNGVEIWGKFKNEDPDNLYLLMEVDLNKGWKSPVTGEWQDLTFWQSQEYITQADDASAPLSSCPIFRTVPIGATDTFYSRYGVSWDKPIGFESAGTGFKTGCVFERRAYYGNIAIKGNDGLIHRYPDGIVKSLAGKYDTFSIDNLIEATVNDGDEITCLKVVGNKLCQFKKMSLTIMGVKVLENGETREVIEQIVHHVGVVNDNQICETPFGLFWISRSGMYLFNGEDIRNLTSNENGSIIDKVTWESFYGVRTHCGYDAYWNQVHIAKEQQNNETTIVYDFNTTAFSEVKGLYSGAVKSGFVNDRHGHLLWAEEPASTPSSNLGMTGSSPANQNNVATSATPALSGD